MSTINNESKNVKLPVPAELPLYERMATMSSEAVLDLVRQHWPAIEADMIDNEKSKITASVSLKFNRISESNYKLNTRILYGSKKSDEREDFIDTDTKQTKLSIEDMKGGRA